MESITDKFWLSAYIFFRYQHEILTECVEPIVKKVFREKYAMQFFYIRYWEGGPHIRLRFRGNQKILFERVKPLIVSMTQEFFEKFDGHERDSSNGNRIEFVEYEPEVQRYGGVEGIKVAEAQFQNSSKAVLSLLSNTRHWDYSDGLRFGIQMHLGFFHSVGYSRREAINVFKQNYLNWIPSAYQLVPGHQQIEPNHLSALITGKLEESFLKNATNLSEFCNEYWRELDQLKKVDQEWLSQWIGDSKKISIDILRIQQLSTGMPAKEAKDNYSTFIDGLIHMTNNRLGILNYDEGYLAYLIMRSLKPN